MVGRGRGEQKWQPALISRSLNYLFGFCSSWGCFFGGGFFHLFYFFLASFISHFYFLGKTNCPSTKDELPFASSFLNRRTKAERPQLQDMRYKTRWLQPDERHSPPLCSASENQKIWTLQHYLSHVPSRFMEGGEQVLVSHRTKPDIFKIAYQLD